MNTYLRDLFTTTAGPPVYYRAGSVVEMHPSFPAEVTTPFVDCWLDNFSFAALRDQVLSVDHLGPRPFLYLLRKEMGHFLSYAALIHQRSPHLTPGDLPGYTELYLIAQRISQAHWDISTLGYGMKVRLLREARRWCTYPQVACYCLGFVLGRSLLTAEPCDERTKYLGIETIPEIQLYLAYRSCTIELYDDELCIEPVDRCILIHPWFRTGSGHHPVRCDYDVFRIVVSILCVEDYAYIVPINWCNDQNPVIRGPPAAHLVGGKLVAGLGELVIPERGAWYGCTIASGMDGRMLADAFGNADCRYGYGNLQALTPPAVFDCARINQHVNHTIVGHRHYGHKPALDVIKDTTGFDSFRELAFEAIACALIPDGPGRVADRALLKDILERHHCYEYFDMLMEFSFAMAGQSIILGPATRSCAFHAGGGSASEFRIFGASQLLTLHEPDSFLARLRLYRVAHKLYSFRDTNNDFGCVRVCGVGSADRGAVLRRGLSITHCTQGHANWLPYPVLVAAYEATRNGPDALAFRLNVPYFRSDIGVGGIAIHRCAALRTDPLRLGDAYKQHHYEHVDADGCLAAVRAHGDAPLPPEEILVDAGSACPMNAARCYVLAYLEPCLAYKRFVRCALRQASDQGQFDILPDADAGPGSDKEADAGFSVRHELSGDYNDDDPDDVVASIIADIDSWW